MTVYVDKPSSFAHKRKQYSHMLADSLPELHSFATLIGLKSHWFDKDHYDLREDEYLLAVENGAVVVSTRELVKVRNSLREQKNKT